MGGTHALMKSVERNIASIPVSALGNSETRRRGPEQPGKSPCAGDDNETFFARLPGRRAFGATAEAAITGAPEHEPIQTDRLRARSLVIRSPRCPVSRRGEQQYS